LEVTEIVEASSTLQDIWHSFRNLAHICGKTARIFVNFLAEMYTWTKKSPLNFGSHPDPYPDRYPDSHLDPDFGFPMACTSRLAGELNPLTSPKHCPQFKYILPFSEACSELRVRLAGVMMAMLSKCVKHAVEMRASLAPEKLSACRPLSTELMEIGI